MRLRNREIKTTETFTPFKRLPIELRHIIWRFSLEARVVEVRWKATQDRPTGRQSTDLDAIWEYTERGQEAPTIELAEEIIYYSHAAFPTAFRLFCSSDQCIFGFFDSLSPSGLAQLQRIAIAIKMSDMVIKDDDNSTVHDVSSNLQWLADDYYEDRIDRCMFLSRIVAEHKYKGRCIELIDEFHTKLVKEYKLMAEEVPKLSKDDFDRRHADWVDKRARLAWSRRRAEYPGILILHHVLEE
ncbi:uncharacterized protein PAC_08556 [Phialocephala subalpina]|uniref:2EXR domain-containing protein n=1 Tax=Phialocephala subalpina TaxID=576137 RepID=A0A1L7X0V5_9HELO|nr:uncharacterized protein PAC_08556 [Phialocephala subalpina]